MAFKSQTLSKFLEFKTIIEKQYNSVIKILFLDGDGEYPNANFTTILKKICILH